MQHEDFISLTHGYVELQKDCDNTDECLVYTPPIIVDFQTYPITCDTKNMYELAIQKLNILYYLKKFEECSTFIFTYLVDPEKGEWINKQPKRELCEVVLLCSIKVKSKILYNLSLSSLQLIPTGDTSYKWVIEYAEKNKF